MGIILKQTGSHHGCLPWRKWPKIHMYRAPPPPPPPHTHPPPLIQTAPWDFFLWGGGGGGDMQTFYRIYPKYSNTWTPNHTCSKIWTSTIYYPMLCLKIARWVVNSVEPDETPRSAASHLDQHCLLRPVCPNTYGIYGRSMFTANEGVQSYQNLC